jgi:hypothetical protein
LGTVALFQFEAVAMTDRLEDLGLAAIVSEYETLVERHTGGRVVVTSVQISPTEFAPVGGFLRLDGHCCGDTVMLWCAYDPIAFQVAVDIVLDIFCECFRSGVPMRGAITFGDAVMDKSGGVFVGAPLLEATRAVRSQSSVGCTFGPSLDRFPHLGPLDRFQPYPIQVPPGLETDIRPLALDWPRRMRDKFPSDDVYALISAYRRILPRGCDWDATVDFVNHSASNTRWW